MEFYLLASGSYGNCTLIKANGKNILVDFGLGIIETKTKLFELGCTLEDIDAVLITHEHSDHIKSIQYLKSDKIYATFETLSSKVNGFNQIKPLAIYDICGIHIMPIPISHDVKNGVGYIIDDGNERMIYMTDTGYVNRKYYELLKNADHYIFESNHNVDMLLRTSRPFFLKRRILSDEGHLSNEDCAEILAKLIGSNTKTIVLAHLSEDANTKELAYTTVREILLEKELDISNIEIKSADRYEITKGREAYAYKK